MGFIALIKYGFSIVGAGLLGLGIYLAINAHNFTSTSATATGYVVKNATSRSASSELSVYTPIIAFTTQDGDPVVFASASSSSPPMYDVGETVTVLYPPDNPHDAEISGFFHLWGAALITGGLGVVFLGVGVTLLALGYVKARRIQRLERDGLLVHARVTGVEVNENVLLNGRHPLRIFAEWNDPTTGELVTFRSDNRCDPLPDDMVGAVVPVRVDRIDRRRYHMDTSGITLEPEY